MPRPLIANRHERILDAAEALILTRGFDGASIQAIAEAAGIAKGAIYREFPGKVEIMDALLQRAMGRINRRYAELIGHDMLPSLSLGYRAGTQALLSEPLMVAALLDDAGILGQYVETGEGDRYRRRFLDTADWIRKLQRAGRLMPVPEADSLALALSCASLGLLTAQKTLGPLTAQELEGALMALEALIKPFEEADKKDRTPV